MRARASLIMAVAAIATIAVPAHADTWRSCAPAAHPGGQWRSYGHDLANTRNQPDEKVINAGNAGNLRAHRVIDLQRARHPSGTPIVNAGTLQNTPIVADGCLYLATSTGWVLAVNADDGLGPNGEVAWSTVDANGAPKPLAGAGQTLLGGVIVGSPVVAEGKVFVGVSNPGQPYVVALDQATGVELWRTIVEGAPIGFPQKNALINASPVYYRVNGVGYIFQGFAGNEGGDTQVPALIPADNGAYARGGFAILRASDGARLVHTYTIDDKEFAAGYRGASVWCTAAVDEAASSIYACGGNPASRKLEAKNSNALLKIDGDPASATFGKIVDSYKGDTDQYYPGLDRQPACDMFGDRVIYVAWSVTCLQLDLDFGASPNLFPDALGNLMLGALQKSGVYHTVFADTMGRSWTTPIAPPCFACNASSSATSGGSIFAVGTPPGTMVSLTTEGGRYRWAAPVGGGTHFQSVSTANGAVYTMDNSGSLNVYDASVPGLLVFKRPLALDVGRSVNASESAGVAIARNTIYAATAGVVVTYR